MEKEFYVLYGSQTGNSEFISKDLHTKLEGMGIRAVCMTLNAAKKINLKEKAAAVIIVCSTTGNGDAPENCDAFWRALKARSTAKDHCEGLPFSVLGLGDTNYDKFCHMGKVIDKRLAELGGHRIVDLHCADEACNIEEIVEAWKVKIIAAVTAIHDSLLRSSGDACEGQLSVSLKEAERALDSLELNEFKCDKVVPEGVTGPAEVWNLLNLEGDISAPPAAKFLPACSSGATEIEILGNIPSSTPERVSPESPTETARTKGTGQSSVEYSVEQPFHATVIKARYLTENSSYRCIETTDKYNENDKDEKRVIEACISLTGSGIRYEPGDSIAVCCPNPKILVDFVLNRLNVTSIKAGISLYANTLIRPKDCGVCSLEEFLSYRIDLVGLPRKAGVMKLSQCCTDPSDASILQHICSKGDSGKKMWRHFVEAQGLGIGELLAMFPSCSPTLDQLAQACGPLPPRCYSIASSPLVCPFALRIAFSAVSFTCGVNIPPREESTPNPLKLIHRRGLCTTYLERIFAPWLRTDGIKEEHSVFKSVKIRIFLKPTINFKLPGSTSYPLVLIGPGTGVAPFIGFLEHRCALEKERTGAKHSTSSSDLATLVVPTTDIERSISGSSKGAKECCMGEWRGGIELDDLPVEGTSVDLYLNSVPPGPVWLFFGCRNTSDFLFKSELQNFLHETHTLDVLEVAYSRINAEKVYVTHKILSRGAELANMILNQTAYVYICGDGNKMAKDVETAFLDILQRFGGEHGVASATDAAAIIADMKHRRRFVLDIWS